MKKLFTLGAFMLAAASAFAGSGKAIVPSLQYYWSTSTHYLATVITVTNITDHPVVVTPAFYDKDGNLVPSAWVNYLNFTNSNTQLAARSTGRIIVVPSSSTPDSQGFGTIEWTNLSGDNDTVALVAHGVGAYLLAASNRESKWAVPINNGLPF